MTYEFTNEKVGAMKLQHFHNNTGEMFNIAGIDAQQPDANVIKKTDKANCPAG
ncbi:MAG: hypothetical protein IKE46_05535 [Selenomonadaceae bacterium]|nr:hypothetical protein [Selenomonadaceae bacterium]